MSRITKEELEDSLYICKRKLFALYQNFNKLNEELRKAKTEAKKEEIEDKLWNIVKRKGEYEQAVREIEYDLGYPCGSIETEWE